MTGVQKLCVYNSYNFQNKNLKHTPRNKKKENKSNINSVKKDKVQIDTIHISIYIFRFYRCISNLVLKILGIANTHLVNTNIYIFPFFWNLKVQIFENCYLDII
jgi:hypothetical protein